MAAWREEEVDARQEKVGKVDIVHVSSVELTKRHEMA